MRNIKDFQARYDRWKNGERYWDIRGINLPQYDNANKNTITTDDGSVFNVYPSAIGARNLEVTTPEVEVIAQKPLYLKKRDQLLGDVIYNPGEIRQGEEPSALDNVRTFLGSHRDNPIARNVEQSIEDWQHHKTPMQASFDNFAYMNPYTAAIAAGSNLFSDHGVSKTINLAKNGQYGRAALSGLGDLFDASILSYGGRYIKNNGMFDAAKLFENTRFGDYLRSKIISNNLNRSITELPNGRFRYQDKVLPYKRIELPQKQGNGRYQFDSPTYQVYTGPKHDISEIINTDGSVNLRNLLNIQNEALQNIPGGTIARHRLENAKWHPTDWNTFLHTRDAYKRALDNNYPHEALFPTLMHDFGKMWAGDGHGPYGASILQQMFPKATKEQIAAIYQHMDKIPTSAMGKLVKGADIAENNMFRDNVKNLTFQIRGEKALGRQFQPSRTQYDLDDKNSKELIKYLNSSGYDTSILSARDAQDLENIRRASIIDAGINSGKRFGIFSNNSNDWVDLYNKAGSNIGTLSVDANGTGIQNRLAQHTIGLNPINDYYNIDNVPGVHMVRNLTSDWEIPEKGVSKDMYDIFLQAMRQKGNDKGLLSGYRLLQPEKTTAITSNKNYRTITIPGTGLHDILTPNGRKTVVGDSKILLYPRNPNVAFKSTAFDPDIINENGIIITDFNNPSMYYNYGKNA